MFSYSSVDSFVLRSLTVADSAMVMVCTLSLEDFTLKVSSCGASPPSVLSAIVFSRWRGEV